MREPVHQVVDLLSVLKRSTYQKALLDHYRLVVEDPDKALRRAEAQCVICWHSGRIGGSMCTDAICGLCSSLMKFASTNVDVLCKKCALEKHLCRHCGADLELKQRRKL